MKRDVEQLSEYLGHILDAIERIEKYVEDMNEIAFLENELVQDAVIRNLEIIGEASRNILKHFPAFASVHQELPLATAYQMRNALAHGYFKIDFEIVWKTIQNNLFELHNQIKQVLLSLE